MKATNMATLTASLERSLQNCSLNHPSDAASGAFSRSANSDRRRYFPSLLSSDSSSSSNSSASATLVELNSHTSLPYHWEQCLDLKTGEIYYVNWRSGKKAKEDPRLTTTATKAYSSCSDEEDDNDNQEDSYDSEGSSSTGYSSLSSMENDRVVGKAQSYSHQNDVLVVAGCKVCLMYYMVPKHVEDCPKCTGQLLHFDRSDENAYPSSP